MRLAAQRKAERAWALCIHCPKTRLGQAQLDTQGLLMAAALLYDLATAQGGAALTLQHSPFHVIEAAFIAGFWHWQPFHWPDASELSIEHLCLRAEQ